MKIIADTHTHTVASTHAYSTLLENVQYAKKAGLRAIAITDHGPSRPDAPHMWHFSASNIVPKQIDFVSVLFGVEANIIDFNGTLDVPNNILKGLDWVIASFHRPACAPGNIGDHTNAYLNILQNPYVDVIGHSGTEDFKYDYERVIVEAGKANKLIEINSRSSEIRIGADKNCREIAEICKKNNVPVIVNSDSHIATSVGNVEAALNMLSSIDFPEELIINADYLRFSEYLKQHKGIYI